MVKLENVQTYIYWYILVPNVDTSATCVCFVVASKIQQRNY